MSPQKHLVAIVSAMALREAAEHSLGADWVASMVDQACRTVPIPGRELQAALDMLMQERRALIR